MTTAQAPEHRPSITPIEENSSNHKILIEALARLEILLNPASTNDIKAMLGKLAIHYSLGKMDEYHQRSLFEDYIEDLAKYPAWMIEGACIAYRRNVENEFFPKIGKLLQLMNREYYQLIREQRAIEEILSKAVQPKQIEASRPTAEQWKQLTDSLGA